MKKITTLFGLVFSLSLFAGPPDGSHDWISWHSSMNLSGTYHDVDFSLLNKQLSLWGSKQEFSRNYLSYGITFISGKPSERYKGKWDGSTTYEWNPKQTISIGSNDSLTFTMKGWHVMTSSFGKDLIPGRAVALVLAPGIDWGTMKIFANERGAKSKYKNPFVAPLVRADLRFVFGHFSFGGRAFYRYDISYSLWKRKTDNALLLPGTHFTGLNIQTFIGYDFGE